MSLFFLSIDMGRGRCVSWDMSARADTLGKGKDMGKDLAPIMGCDECEVFGSICDECYLDTMEDGTVA